MKLAQLCVDRPVSTIVAVLLLALFGIISMFRLPVQMKPTVDKPIIRIQTSYWGAAPPEI